MGNCVQITASNWQLLSPLVDEALALEPEARSAWLDAQTQLSEAVHAQLAELIAVANAPETNTVLRTLPSLAADPTNSAPPMTTRSAGDVVGVYTLLRVIGRGGMAEVWLARRNDGAYERDIALKLPLSHLPLNHATERLLRERNVLAALEHPSIARLYDAGVTPDGQPFLAMEYVEGVDIREYAALHKLTLRARSLLVVQVLEALQYAHQRLVVHRDLKPSNILVRADGRVALLDFGIAKVLEASDGALVETELTRVGGSAMTRAYAAPEQLMGEAVTTASDVYAVGVVLHELLVGKRPFAATESQLGKLLAAMEIGAKPLTPQASTPDEATQYGVATVNAWHRALNGDLDAICRKAIRFEAASRYPTALAMAEDLRRCWLLQPVLARGGKWTYHTRKFLARNRAAIVAISVGSVMALGFALHALRATESARTSDVKARAYETVITSLFAGMSPEFADVQTFTAKEILARSLAGIPDSVLTLGLAQTLARTCENMFDLPNAKRFWMLSLQLAQPTSDYFSIGLAQASLALIASTESDWPAALAGVAAARATALLLSGPKYAELIASAYLVEGRIAELQGRYADADNAYAAGVQAMSIVTGDPMTLRSDLLLQRATVAQMTLNLPSARALIREAEQVRDENKNWTDEARARYGVHAMLLDEWAGDYRAGIAHGEAALTDLRQRVSPQHGSRNLVATRLAAMYARTGAIAKAEAILDEQRGALLNVEGQIGIDARQSLAIAQSIVHMMKGEHPIAANLMEQLRIETEPADKRLAMVLQRRIAEVNLRAGLTDTALRQLSELHDKAGTANGLGPQDRLHINYLFGIASLQKSQFKEALALLQRLPDEYQRTLGIGNPFAGAASMYVQLAMIGLAAVGERPVAPEVAAPITDAERNAVANFQNGAALRAMTATPFTSLRWREVPVLN